MVEVMVDGKMQQLYRRYELCTGCDEHERGRFIDRLEYRLWGTKHGEPIREIEEDNLASSLAFLMGEGFAEFDDVIDDACSLWEDAEFEDSRASVLEEAMRDAVEWGRKRRVNAIRYGTAA